jgi:hypothetical protein
MTLRQAGLTTVATFLLSTIPVAAQAQDADGDLVPDAIDNCLDIPNGPNEWSHQVDTNQDGYGNRCDADVNNDGLVGGERDVG